MNRFTKIFDEADRSFNYEYNTILKDLEKELEQLNANGLKPKVKCCEELIKIVEAASEENLSRAEFAQKINKLGTKVKDIAKCIPGLNSFL